MRESKRSVWNVETLSGPFLGGTLAGAASALMVHPRLGVVFGVVTFAVLTAARVLVGDAPPGGRPRVRARHWVATAVAIVVVALFGALILRLSKTSEVLPAPSARNVETLDAAPGDSGERAPDVQEFMAWARQVEPRLGHDKELESSCSTSGICSANLAAEGGVRTGQFAREEPAAWLLTANFPGTVAHCELFGPHTVERKWSYAGVAKSHCILPSGRQVVIEQNRESVRLLLFTSSYLEHDTDFARVVRDQGTGF